MSFLHAAHREKDGKHRQVSRTYNPSKKSEASLTEQSHAESADIHFIMRQQKEKGILTHLAKYEGSYMNLIDAPDFVQAEQQIAEAKTMFETVPSHVRNDFDNSPAKFLAFMQNADNRDAISEYGLDTSHLPPLPETPPAPVEVVVTNPTTPPEGV